MKVYLKQTIDIPSRHCHTLIIDGCHMSDDSFSLILEGIIAQTPTKKARLHLNRLVYSHNYLGDKSITLLISILSNLEELSLIGIKNNLHTGQIKSVIEGIAKYGWRLSKLKLSNINLNDIKLVRSIVWMMQNQSKVLYSLDLSWSNLSAQSMSLIAEQLALYPWTFKYINLSYNSLNFR